MQESKKEKISIEQQMNKLQRLAREIEDNKSSIDQSFAAFEEAGELVKKIKNELNVYKKKAEMIVDSQKNSERNNDLENDLE